MICCVQSLKDYKFLVCALIFLFLALFPKENPIRVNLHQKQHLGLCNDALHD